ncbi:13766_t:CDS:2 [Rhizophagus irregularis]|nr:13766_t:CDS:2 [Rhizophagus irregularis]
MGGCHIHWKRRQRHPCKQDGCVRPIASKYGYCNWHVNKCHSNAYYHQKKLNKMFQSGQTPEAMREALDKIKSLDSWKAVQMGDHSDHRKNQTMDASVDVGSRVFDAFRSLKGFTDG